MTEDKHDDRYEAFVCGLLVAATLVVFWQVRGFDFINLDDDEYVPGNPIVLAGLTRAGVVWAFTTGHMANWHPVTWLSHMLDAQLFGPKPAGPHVVNVVFHTANVLLLFLFLRRATHALWPCALVAALFAVHPLHVESVAWIAERKDVLSGLFWMLTLLAYVWYTEQPRWTRYLVMAILFALGLMAKPMLVTLPCALLLLDYWPLRRFAVRGTVALVLEKVPLFALAAVSSIITFKVQSAGQAMVPFDLLPLHLRIGNALVSYVTYIGKTLYPADLAVPYLQFWRSITAGQILLAAAVLLGITAFAILQVRRRPYLLVGWLWFLGTLVPVIGIVQVGGQALADRYTYIPLIGLFIMFAWAAADKVREHHEPRIVVVGAIGLILVLLCCRAYTQTSYWRDSITLFQHSLEVNEANSTAHNNLGTALLAQGRFDEAAVHFTRSLEIAPSNIDALNNLGAAWLLTGRPDKAAEAFTKVLASTPKDPTVYSNLGVALLNQGKRPEAKAQFLRALELDPACSKAREVLRMMGEPLP